MTAGSKLYIVVAMGDIHSAPYSPNGSGKNIKVEDFALAEIKSMV